MTSAWAPSVFSHYLPLLDISQVCRAWEAAAQNASSVGARVAVLRFGIVLAPEVRRMQKGVGTGVESAEVLPGGMRKSMKDRN